MGLRACRGMNQSHLVSSLVFCRSPTNKSRVTALSDVNLSTWVVRNSITFFTVLFCPITIRSPPLSCGSHISLPDSLCWRQFGICCSGYWSAVSTHHFCCRTLYYIIYLFLYLLCLFSHPRCIPIHHQNSTPNMAGQRLRPWAVWITATKFNLLEVLSLSSRIDRPRFGNAFITEQHLEGSQLPLLSDELAISFLVSVFKARTETGLTSCL